MPAKVNGLGHIGFYVQDLELMKDFYSNFIGMTLTKVSAGGAFFSADPEACDHESIPSTTFVISSGASQRKSTNWTASSPTPVPSDATSAIRKTTLLKYSG